MRHKRPILSLFFERRCERLLKKYTNFAFMVETFAIIVAAGRGSRFGGTMPKQFLDLDGRPLLMTTIDRFAAAIDRSHIIVVLDKTMEAFWLELCAGNGFASPKIVYGGATRWESVRNAVMELQADDEAIVMVHDGARPLVPTAMIERLASQVADADGVIPGVAVTDSLRAVDGNRSTAVDRSRFVAVQTPQTFPLGVLRSAYRRPYEPTMTDDASVVEAAGFTNLVIARGEPTNIKVTNPADLALAQTLLKLQQQ